MSDSDIRLASVYASAVHKENDLLSLLEYLKESPELLEMIIQDWLETTLGGYAFCASSHGHENAKCPDVALELGDFVPTTFAKAARLAFSKFMLKSKQDLAFTDENIDEIQNWLSDTHPDILQDIQSEEASNHSHINSPSMKDWESELFKKIRRISEGKE